MTITVTPTADQLYERARHERETGCAGCADILDADARTAADLPADHGMTWSDTAGWVTGGAR